MAPTCKNGPCQICIAVEKIDEEINQATTTPRHLLVKRCNLRSEQNRVHGGSMHRFPVEIKNHIFELLLPSRDEWGKIPKIEFERTVMPSYLASICRQWRDIAWSNPFLWSTICIDLGLSRPSSDIRDVLHDWILRSRTLPLTLYVQGDSDDHLEGVIEIISQFSNRWHSLSLDLPWELLYTFPRNVHHIPLKRLRIIGRGGDQQLSVPFLNPNVSPEKIELVDVSFHSLPNSWNHLLTAKVECFDLEEITQLFQHASQMTYCDILLPQRRPENFSMPPIIHQKLETLSLCSARHADFAAHIIGSFTLPSLQEFHCNEMVFLTPTYLPALVHRSSCPLTRITLFKNLGNSIKFFGGLKQPLPGVTDLVVETLEGEHALKFKELLLGDFFPDLRHLTLRLRAFLHLWDADVIPLLLDHKRPRPDGANEGRLHKFLVVNQDPNIHEFGRWFHEKRSFNDVWNSNVGEQLKALNVSLREGGFEF